MNNENMGLIQGEIMDAISCGVLAYTIPGYGLVSANRSVREIMDCGEKDDALKALKHFITERIVADDRKKVVSAAEKLKSPGDTAEVNFCAVTSKGRTYVKCTLKMLELPDGQRCILSTMMDITEQMVLANTIAQERRNYREALVNGCEYSYDLDLTEGIIHEDFVTARGLSVAEEFGIKFPVSFDRLNNEFIKKSGVEFPNLKMALLCSREGLLGEFEKGNTNVSTEYYIPKYDIFTRVTALMSKDEYSGHVNALITAFDITDVRRKDRLQNNALKEANIKLRRLNCEINARIDAILNGISGGLKIADVDNDFKYAFISDGAAGLQGYTVEEFLRKFGNRVTSNIHPEDSEGALREAKAQMARKGNYSVKYRVLTKGGSTKWVIDRGKLVVDEFGRKFWYILMQDVTELETRNHKLSSLVAMQNQMYDSLGSGILSYTLPEYNILICNQEARRIFGFGEGCVRGDMIMENIAAGDYGSVMECIRTLTEPGDYTEYIMHIVHGDGNIYAARTVTKLLSFENGQKFILSAMVDITEQERTEKNLIAERRQYREALAFDSLSYFTVDLTDGMFREHSAAGGGEDIVSKFGLDIPVGYDELAAVWFAGSRVMFLKNDCEIIRSREKLIEHLKSGGSRIDVEYFSIEENKYYNVQVLLSESVLNGHVIAGFFIYDVTDERKEERKNRSIIYSLGRIYYGLYHFSLWDNSYISVRQHEDISDDIHGKGNIRDFIKIYSEKYVMPEFRQVMEDFLDPDTICERFSDAETESIEYMRVNLGWCRATLVAAERTEGGIINSVILAVSLIEKQKQLELSQREALRTALNAANAANSAKTEFLANMSHDIRTPMNAIIGMTAIAGTHLDDKDRVSDCLSKITMSSKHLLGLINEILDMSKIESGKVDLQEEEFNLPDLIDNMLTMSKPLVQKKNHSLSISIYNIEHENVIGDSQRIQQAFMNIMSNAIKYTPDEGKISITICEKPTNKRHIGCYEFIFEDNGIGMSSEFIEHIFEPFARASEDKRVLDIRGTGLGMPITKNIVQMMNGNIKVESEINKGTKITVDIILKLQKSNEEVDYKEFIGLPVLVVDDDEVVRDTACIMLGELGMKGESVTDGAEAVEKVCSRHEAGDDYFAVIVDWKMPDMDGIDVTREIRRRAGKMVPIIIISAYDWSDIELEARAAGANAFVSKPLFKSRMAHVFNDLLGVHEDKCEDNAIDTLINDDFSGRRALLVEDNEINAEIAMEILGMTGLEIEWAKNGSEAVDKISASEDGYYDIVFMDIQMPVMNGYEASRAIRAIPRDYTRGVPIVAMTANAFAQDVAASKNAGMNEHIAKPLDFTQLSKCLKRWLR